jgi:serine/threonine-protein kinase
MDRVLALCDRLREDGVEAWIDQYETAPPEGWPLWCEKQVAAADFVLVVCTEVYERRFRGDEAPGTGLGVRWEGYVVRQELYDDGTLNTKYVPVLWSPAGTAQIPLVLRGATRYGLDRAEAYQDLYRHLTSQPKTPAPPLGPRIPMPPQERRTRFSAVPELVEELAAMDRRLKELTLAGQDTAAVREQILGLRRVAREGRPLEKDNRLGEGRFHLLEIIGRGGFATVWKAWDEERKELVAVKILHGLHAEDRTRRERFFRGARKMAELHHPGIVRVLATELEENGKHFFVMDYVGGGDLRRAVLAGELPREKILPVLLAVGEALAFAHEKGVVHRDVKPANILLDGDRPKLTDFDLVRAFDTTGGTQTQGLLGTVLYSAPEMLGDAKSASVAADVYSLAMTAVFAFHGRDLPPDVWRRPEAFLEKVPCPPALRVVLGRGIAWEPQERPASVVELCEELRLAAAAPAAGKERRGKGPTGSREPVAGEERLHENAFAELLTATEPKSAQIAPKVRPTKTLHQYSERIDLEFWADIDLRPLGRAFEQEIIGQRAVKQGILNSLKFHSARCRELLLSNPAAVKTADDARYRLPVFSLFGASGMGKTTFCRLIANLFGDNKLATIIDLAGKLAITETFGLSAPNAGWDQESPLIRFARESRGLGLICFDDITRVQRIQESLASSLGPLSQLLQNRSFVPANPHFAPPEGRYHMVNSVFVFLGNVSPQEAPVPIDFEPIEALGPALVRRLSESNSIFYFEPLRDEDLQLAMARFLRTGARRWAMDFMPHLARLADDAVVEAELFIELNAIIQQRTSRFGGNLSLSFVWDQLAQLHYERSFDTLAARRDDRLILGRELLDLEAKP